MLAVFIGLTVSVERVLDAGKHKVKNQAASYSALFFIYAFSPCYNIGNNALTYSRPLPLLTCWSAEGLRQS